ncbi:MAG: radical SAM protein [Dehalococcoidales bacterium]|nr:radical SAM protein [Dehalococcoidales bacterium]
MTNSLVYGPVPSRRLGRSLGINNIPPKRCSYSCIYCQLGHTAGMQIKRRAFYEPLELARSVTEKVRQIREKGELIDYLAFVPDGEPTLDISLGKEIELLRDLGIKIAVITNASLIRRDDVQQSLQKADWISLKVDAVTYDIWHRINRPHEKIKLDNILEGMLDFSKSFQGELTTETMLIKGINDSEHEFNKIAAFIAELKPAKSYLAAPTRPPAEQVEPANEQSLNTAYQIFSEKLDKIEYLIGYEGNAFASTGNAVDDLLSITAVHPMREDALAEFIENTGTGWNTIQELVDTGNLIILDYQGKKFYLRKLPAHSHNSYRPGQKNQ